MAQVHCLRAQLEEHQMGEHQIDQLIEMCKKEFSKLSEDGDSSQSYPFVWACVHMHLFMALNCIHVGIDNIQRPQVNWWLQGQDCVGH